MLRAVELGRNHMEMRDPGTIAGGRPALLRQGRTNRRPETHESLDAVRMGHTMREKETWRFLWWGGMWSRDQEKNRPNVP